MAPGSLACRCSTKINMAGWPLDLAEAFVLGFVLAIVELWARHPRTLGACLNRYGLTFVLLNAAAAPAALLAGRAVGLPLDSGAKSVVIAALGGNALARSGFRFSPPGQQEVRNVMVGPYQLISPILNSLDAEVNSKGAASEMDAATSLMQGVVPFLDAVDFFPGWCALLAEAPSATSEGVKARVNALKRSARDGMDQSLADQLGLVLLRAYRKPILESAVREFRKIREQNTTRPPG